MVNNPNSVPPTGGGSQGPNAPDPAANKKPKNTGTYQFTGDHKFLGMDFTAKDWNKLMNIMLNNMSDFINKTFQKMTEKLKKDWQRGAGDDDVDP
jgi:hypothetical protein